MREIRGFIIALGRERERERERVRERGTITIFHPFFKNMHCCIFFETSKIQFLS